MNQAEKCEYEVPCCQLIQLEAGNNMLVNGSTKDLQYDESL